MKRLKFILLTLAASISGVLRARLKVNAEPTETRRTWAELINEEVARTNRRRFEHLLHGQYCSGVFDVRRSLAEAYVRKVRCTKICGLCRYIYSLKDWPQPKYRQPPQDFLDELETQEWCLTWKTEDPYRSPRHGSSCNRRPRQA